MAATPFVALTFGSKNVVAAPKSNQICLRCSKRKTPCFCHTPNLKKLSSCAWRKTDDNYYSIGDTYHNSLDFRTYTYIAGKDGYPNFWQPHFGMMCHICLQNARLSLRVKPYDAMLSVVCNTWPVYSDKWKGKCCCGHPWLKTATEDYVRRQEGESDQEREYRRNYPTIRLWEQYKHCRMFNYVPGIMGVDQIAPLDGDTLRYHYRTSNGPGNGMANWNKLADIMFYHQIRMCVIDPNPWRHQAVKFQRLFPGHVIFCQYRQCEAPLVWNTVNYPNNNNVFANRDYWYRGDHPAAFCEIARELECARRYEREYK